jgi:large conductance mechanosensitive channel
MNLLITGLVNDLFTPLLFQPALKSAGIDKITDLAYNGILYGKVVSALIDFVIVAFIVFVFAKKAMKEELVSKESKNLLKIKSNFKLRSQYASMDIRCDFFSGSIDDFIIEAKKIVPRNGQDMMTSIDNEIRKVINKKGGV